MGRNTFLADALRSAGARPALEPAQDWPNVSLESVVRAATRIPDFSADDRAQALQQIDGLRNQPGWRDLRRCATAESHHCAPKSISHPSPRLMDAIEELARALYPERFGFKGAPRQLRYHSREPPQDTATAPQPRRAPRCRRRRIRCRRIGYPYRDWPPAFARSL